MTSYMEGLAARFTARYVVESNSGCWLWTGTKNHRGYGSIWAFRKNCGAHRASWLLHHGPIPGDLWVLHKCDVPGCVNPHHLFLGTHLDNMRDCQAKGRNTALKTTHCKYGHEYTPENTLRREGRRKCRACQNELGRRRRKQAVTASKETNHV